jgi:general secretion pathway protein G
MVVVVILGILAALVAPNVMRRIDDAQITKVKQDLRAFETALSLYKMDNYKYPSTDQGLQALIQQPNDPSVRNWKPGGYLGSGGLTKDPWQYDYKYVYFNHTADSDIYTLGADGQEGGEGVNADRGNWQTE